MVLTKHIFDVIIFVKQNVNVNILREITKMRKSALITLFAIMISVFCGAAVVANASGAENESAIADALGNGRVTTVVNEDDSVKLDLEVTDGTPSSTRAYYMYNVDATNFSMTFTLDAFNEDGAMRISFLSGNGDYPMNGYGDGFGVYFWDETAWEHTAYTWLRSDFCTYKSNGDGVANEAKRVCAGDNYVGREFGINITKWNSNIRIGVTMDGTEKEAGEYNVANLPEGFDITNCVLMITPDVDSREHSYEKNVELTVKTINGKAPIIKSEPEKTACIGDALGNDRVTATVNDDDSVKLKLATDTNYSLTRAYYTKNVDVTNFSMTFTLDAFNEDGAMRISFLSSKDDFPMNPYGDGFGVYFWDETAWGHTAYTWLRSDFCTYKRSGSAAGNDGKNVCSGENYIGQTFVLKVWDFDTDNLAISVTRNGAEKPQAIGTYAKANLPEGFDITNCVLMITPDIDSRAHSYDNDIEITIKDINGKTPVAVMRTITFTDGKSKTAVSVAEGESFNLGKLGAKDTETEAFVGYEINGKLYSSDYSFTVNGDVEVKAVRVAFKMEQGAFIRISEPSGIRFTAKLSESDYNALVALVGAENVSLNVYVTNTANGKTAEKEAANRYTKNGTITFSGVLINIPESAYKTKFQGGAFMTVKYEDKETVIKLRAIANDNERSVYEVAVSAAENVEEGSAEKKFLEDVIAAAD